MNKEPSVDSLKKIWDEYGEAITIFAIVFSVIAALVCIGWGICEWQQGLASAEKETVSLQTLGTLGSYLQGAVSSLWGLAGFFIIFVAFLIQAIQFTEQRKQFKLQSDSVSLQTFEASFFQMLGLHNQIVLAMQKTEGAEIKATGRDCFKKWYDDFRQFSFNSLLFENNDGTTSVVDKPKTGIENYEAYYYDVSQAHLGHYFRNLYHMIKFVDGADALRREDPSAEYKVRRRYTSLVRATLSQYELAFLFYNCASELGEEKFKPLVEKYGMLNNFNTDDLQKEEKQNCKLIYSSKAFE